MFIEWSSPIIFFVQTSEFDRYSWQPKAKYIYILPIRISKNFILEVIEFVLENKYFCFSDTYFLQIKGTAMGTKFAHVYASLIFAYLKEKLYVQLEKEFDSEFRQYTAWF